MQEELSFGVWLRKQRRALDLARQAFTDQVGCAEVTLRRTRSVKLARTVADLAESHEIQSVHLAEALHLRSPEVNAELRAAWFDFRVNPGKYLVTSERGRRPQRAVMSHASIFNTRVYPHCPIIP